MTVYEYKEKIYCEKDLSMKDDRYAGDLFDLYWELKEEGICCEQTIYTTVNNEYATYESAEELIEEEFSEFLIEDYKVDSEV